MRAEFRASTFILSMVVILSIMGVLWGFSAQMFSNYGVTVPTRYNETFADLSDTTELSANIEELKQSAYRDPTNSSNTILGKLTDQVDILGLYFKVGFKTAALVPKSIPIYTSLITTATDDSAGFLGSAGPTIAFISIAGMTILLIFFLISVATKWKT